jgi:CRP/FNR family transcriptional regulator, cyclic AMP receptor protein
MVESTSLSVSSGTEVASLLDVDPDLGAGIPPDEWSTARRATAGRLIHLGEGPTDLCERLAERDDVSGCLIVDGILVREVSLGARAVPELLGVGDLLPPHVSLDQPLPCRVATSVIAPTRVLVLGPGFARAAGRWPVLLAAVERRRAAQTDRLAVLGALTQLPRVELRLLTLLWHLSSVWGRVSAEGVVVPFALTHEMLGRFVGAQRPTVTLAARQLEDDGLVGRGDDGTWVLYHGSEETLARNLGPAPAGPSILVRARAMRRGAADTRQESQATRAESQQARRRKHQITDRR